MKVNKTLGSILNVTIKRKTTMLMPKCRLRFHYDLFLQLRKCKTHSKIKKQQPNGCKQVKITVTGGEINPSSIAEFVIQNESQNLNTHVISERLQRFKSKDAYHKLWKEVLQIVFCLINASKKVVPYPLLLYCLSLYLLKT